MVCKQLGLNFIGVELNPEYCEMARQRIENPNPEPEVPDVPGQLDLFAISTDGTLAREGRENET